MRIGWIDCAKGMSIALVVLGHSPAQFLEVDSLAWLKAARIPFFFFLCGLLASETKAAKHVAATKLDSLLVPYLTGCTIALLGSSIINGSTPDPLDAFGIFYASFFYLEWGPLWFLPHLFVVFLVFTLFRQFLGLRLKSPKIVYLILFVLFLWPVILGDIWKVDISFYSFSETIMGWPLGLDYLPITLSFFMLGYCFKNFILSGSQSASYIYSLLPITGLVIFNSMTNSNSIGLALRSYDHWFFSTISALIGIVFLMVMAVLLNKIYIARSVFSFLGANSLVILIFHEVIQRRVFELLSATIEWSNVFIGISSFFIALLTPLLASKLMFERFSIGRYAILGKAESKPSWVRGWSVKS